MKCKHEWRIWGTRLEESGFDHYKDKDVEKHCLIVCTKCGIEQSAEGYSWIEERPVPEYSGSWAVFAKDIIIQPHKFGTLDSTSSAWNPRTKKFYDEARYTWNTKDQQWIKTYPVSWSDYFECLRKMI